ncbi:MAG TPA: hypothetical protein VFV94_06550 [Polyangiaceae bacterium]|nr:hypothetical protein [Polyangiaceae bacterium]
MKRPAFVALVVVALVALAGCRNQKRPPERTEPWLASARASASASPLVRRLTYRLVSSRIDFELPGKRATPKGKLSGGSGELDVDLDDLSHTTGRVAFDLTTLELTGSDGLVDGPNTGRALDWLELGVGTAAERRDTVRRALFEITSLDAGHLVVAPSEARATRRRELVSQWAVKGDLSLHGIRAAESAEVTLILVPAPEPSAPPAELLIRSRRPLVVGLGTHEIRPRDGRGAQVSTAQSVLVDSVGREAKVSFELKVTPQR